MLELQVLELKKKCHFSTKIWFSPSHQPLGECGLFPNGRTPSCSVVSWAASSKGLSKWVQPASSYRAAGARLTREWGSQPVRHRACSRARLAFSRHSHRGSQEGFLPTRGYCCTFWALRQKGTKHWRWRGSCSRSRTSETQTRHSPQALVSRLCLFYFFVFFC